MRREFSLNALYYDPEEETIIDFVNGVKDIRKGVVKSVLPLNSSFSEDPVRMLRAVKYAAITGMKISGPVGRRIRKDAYLLSSASISRLSEELYKILNSRNSEVIMRLMDRYRLFDYLLPGISPDIREKSFLSLGRLDEKMISENPDRGVMIYYLSTEAFNNLGVFETPDRKGPLFMDAVRSLKELLKPLVQPNRDVEEAVRMMFRDRGLKIPRKRPWHSEGQDAVVKRRRRRRRKPAESRKPGDSTS
jgi:poly(A) polymerase